MGRSQWRKLISHSVCQPIHANRAECASLCQFGLYTWLAGAGSQRLPLSEGVSSPFGCSSPRGAPGHSAGPDVPFSPSQAAVAELCTVAMAVGGRVAVATMPLLNEQKKKVYMIPNG